MPNEFPPRPHFPPSGEEHVSLIPDDAKSFDEQPLEMDKESKVSVLPGGSLVEKRQAELAGAEKDQIKEKYDIAKEALDRARQNLADRRTASKMIAGHSTEGEILMGVGAQQGGDQLEAELAILEDRYKKARAVYVGGEIDQYITERSEIITKKIEEEGTAGVFRYAWRWLGEQNLEKFVHPKYLEKPEKELLLKDRMYRGLLRGLSLRTGLVAGLAGSVGLLAGGVSGVFGATVLGKGVRSLAAGYTAAEIAGQAAAFDPKQEFGPDYASKKSFDDTDKEKIDHLLKVRYHWDKEGDEDRRIALEKLLGDFEATMILRGEKPDDTSPFYRALLEDVYSLKIEEKAKSKATHEERERVLENLGENDRKEALGAYSLIDTVNEANKTIDAQIGKSLKSYKKIRDDAFIKGALIATTFGVGTTVLSGWLLGMGGASFFETKFEKEVGGKAQAVSEMLDKEGAVDTTSVQAVERLGHTMEEYQDYRDAHQEKIATAVDYIVRNKSIPRGAEGMQMIRELRNMSSWTDTRLGDASKKVLALIEEKSASDGKSMMENAGILKGVVSSQQEGISMGDFLRRNSISGADAETYLENFRKMHPGLSIDELRQIPIHAGDTVLLNSDTKELVFSGTSGHPLGYHYDDPRSLSALKDARFDTLKNIMTGGVGVQDGVEKFVSYISDTTDKDSHLERFKDYYRAKIGILTDDMAHTLDEKHADLLSKDPEKQHGAKVFFEFLYNRHVTEMKDDPWFVNAQKASQTAVDAVREEGVANVVGHETTAVYVPSSGGGAAEGASQRWTGGRQEVASAGAPLGAEGREPSVVVSSEEQGTREDTGAQSFIKDQERQQREYADRILKESEHPASRELPESESASGSVGSVIEVPTIPSDSEIAPPGSRAPQGGGDTGAPAPITKPIQPPSQRA